mmetsp:Transcript_30178/g.86429  ORF Transcript_30178/g.86429 Transcript_30178/m.86429 type:complete len:283 (-) Transcript_30178:89-937(-)
MFYSSDDCPEAIACCGGRQKDADGDASPSGHSWVSDMGGDEEVVVTDKRPRSPSPELLRSPNGEDLPPEAVPGSFRPGPTLAGMIVRNQWNRRVEQTSSLGLPGVAPRGESLPSASVASGGARTPIVADIDCARESGLVDGEASRGSVASRLSWSGRSGGMREVRWLGEAASSTDSAGDDLEVSMMTPMSMVTVIAPGVFRGQAGSRSPERRERRCSTAPAASRLPAAALENVPSPLRAQSQRRSRSYYMAIRTPDSMVTEKFPSPPSSSASEGLCSPSSAL